MSWLSDTQIKQHYCRYRSKRDVDLMNTIDVLDRINRRLQVEHGRVHNHYDDVVKHLNLDLNIYKEFRSPTEYMGRGELHIKMKGYLLTDINNKQRELINRVVRFCKVLDKRMATIHMIDVIANRINITQLQYTRLLHRYYIEMSADLLRGKGYKLHSNLGVLLFSHLKTSTLKPKLMVDFLATKVKKQELVDNGLVPFNRDVYKAYEATGVADKYVGVTYTCYKTVDTVYQLVWTLCRVKNFRNYRFVKASVHNRNIERYPITPETTISELLYLPRMITTRLIAIVDRFPAYVNNFVRNKESHVYNYRRTYR
jgi:hypothetical protein